MVWQQILNLISIFFVIIVLQFMRKRLRVLSIECDVLDISPQDYTIFVKNIPKNFKALNDDYDDDIKDYFENIFSLEYINGKPKKCKVVYVSLCYNLLE